MAFFIVVLPLVQYTWFNGVCGWRRSAILSYYLIWLWDKTENFSLSKIQVEVCHLVIEEEVWFFLTIRFHYGIKSRYFSVNKILSWSLCIISLIQDMFRKLLCVECFKNAYLKSYVQIGMWFFLINQSDLLGFICRPWCPNWSLR
jgi:hypothetical protein